MNMRVVGILFVASKVECYL